MGPFPSQHVMPVKCDVLITGGGPAGSVAARCLALAGLRVILVSDTGDEQPKVGESLPGAARPMLHHLGLIPWLEKSEPLTNLGNLSCWGSEALVATDFIHDPYGCGWHLNRQRFDRCLREGAEAAGALLLQGHLTTIEQTSQGIKARVGQLAITGKWVIDATGKARAIAGRLGINRHRDPPLFAVYGWCHHPQVDTRSVVEAVATGWWYSAGLPSGQRILALHTLPEQAKALMRNPDGFMALLRQSRHVQRWLPQEEKAITQLHVTDAAGSYLAASYGDRWLAVGDAAVSFDPLSSQGIYNAIFTGLRGAQAVKQKLLTNDDALLMAYDERIAEIRATYYRESRRYYQQEQRWCDQPFWVLQQSDMA